MSSRWERGVVRTTSGLSLLLMLSAPLSLVPTIWDGDFRWLLTGAVLGIVGLGLGALVAGSGRKQES